MDRVDEAQHLIDDPTNNPEIAGAGPELLGTTPRTMSRVIVDRGASEQLLHGEPHPGSVLRTKDGLLSWTLSRAVAGPSSSTSPTRPSAGAGRRSRSARAMPADVMGSSEALSAISVDEPIGVPNLRRLASRRLWVSGRRDPAALAR